MTNPASPDSHNTPNPSPPQAPDQFAGQPMSPDVLARIADVPTQAITAPSVSPSQAQAPQPQPSYPAMGQGNVGAAPQYPQQPVYPQPQPHYIRQQGPLQAPQQPPQVTPQPQQPYYPQQAPYPQPYPQPQPPYNQLPPQYPPQSQQPAPYPQQPPYSQPVYGPPVQQQQSSLYPAYGPPVQQPSPYLAYAPPTPQPQPSAPQYQQPTPPQQLSQQAPQTPYPLAYAPQPAPMQPVVPVAPAQGLQGGATPTRFEPQLGMQLQIGEARFGFMPHPIFGAEMDEVFVIEAGEALIYQLQDVSNGALYALKVMKPSYRGEEIARSVASLRPYATLPGLQLGNRLCLTRAEYPALIAALPDLEYAVLMPWLTGRTWAGLLTDRAASETYYARDALQVALRTAQALWELEAHHMAHTDVASGNVMLLSEKGEIALLDVETLYMQNTPPPRFKRLGTPGYQHPRLDARGQWRPEGDRFAGAVLLTEMLTWWDPAVRALTPDGAESLFQPQELQSLTLPRWQAARDTLWNVCPPALALFDQAWAATDLADCPELGAWAMVLLQQSGA